jgi:hypothetical protein
MSACARCGATLSCAMLGEMDGPCWCTQLPPALPVPTEAAGCLCRACLKMQIAALQSSRDVPPHD